MTSFVYLAASLIAIAVSQDPLPGVEQVVPEPAMRIAPRAPHATVLKKVDASFYQKAKAQIAEMMESGKSKKECSDAAKEMKKQVEESVKAQQKVLDKMERGKQCATRGQKAVNDAVASLGGAKDKVKAAEKALHKASKKKINFTNFHYDQLKEGKCGSFFNQQVWKTAKTAVTQATNTQNHARMNQKAAEKALANAKIEAARLVRKCKCNTKKLLKKTRTDMNNKARAENTKAWRQAAHLQCVLDGKQNMNNCPVGTLPEVKPVKLEESVEKACYQEWRSTGNYRVINAAGQNVKFTLYSLPEMKGWVNNDPNWKSRYIKVCKDEGMVPVGCGTRVSWPTYDCRATQRANNCMGLPQGFKCNAIDSARRITNFKGNLIGYYTNGEGYNSNYFYTTDGPPSTSQKYHPLCGKYGTTQGWPKYY